MSTEIAALRSEVSELKEMLISISAAMKAAPTSVPVWSSSPMPPAANHYHWGDDADIPQEAILEGIAQGDRSLLHRRNRARRALAKRKAAGVYK